MRLLPGLCIATLVIHVAATNANGQEAQAAAPSHPRPPSSAAPAEDGMWLMPAKNYASTRYSELDEINADNVAKLELAFTVPLDAHRGQESAVLVAGNTLYFVSAFPNTLYAIDLANKGEVKWRYEPKPEPAAQGVACCDVVNRGPTLSEGRVFFATLDGHAVAVDAQSGREVWKTRIADIQIGETITMAPLVVKNKVLVGNSGGEFGVRGWLKALDVASGKVVWTAYSTGPDKDVLIGPDFKPFYDSDKGSDLGVKTWPPNAWEQGGGTVWGWISYDPDLNLIYYGTANPGPWNSDQRPGDNKWTSGLFARDADTGDARWFYQFSPHDLFDWDGINEQILLDMEWNGAPRKTLVRPERNGHVYVIDRTSGEVLSAEQFGPNTTTRGVDLKTGRLIHIEEKKPTPQRVLRDVCPAASGAKDWNPSAYSPKTGLLYIPHSNLCMDVLHMQANYIAGTPYLGSEVRFKAGPGGHRGVMQAWDVRAAKPAWKRNERFPLWSGALATAGDVVFYGDMEGAFKALDARSGALLWSHRTESGIIGQPSTFRAPDGKQYVAILSGVGGWAGAVVSADLDTRDSTAAGGFVNAMRDLPQSTTKGGKLYVFRLP